MSGRDFDGFTVVITGASTGLGRAIAVEVARRGAGLVVVNYARSADEAAETARLVEAEDGRDWSKVTGDCCRRRRRHQPSVANQFSEFAANFQRRGL